MEGAANGSETTAVPIPVVQVEKKVEVIEGADEISNDEGKADKLKL